MCIRDRANHAAGQLMTVTALISGGVMLLCLLFCKPLLKLLFGSVEPAVMEAAVTYFWISAISFPFLGLYNSSAALFRSMEKTQTTMYVSLLMNVINVAGNAIGVFLFHAGVAGVAVPTLISRAVAAVVMTCLSRSEKNTVFIRAGQVFSWDPGMIRRILRIAAVSYTHLDVYKRQNAGCYQVRIKASNENGNFCSDSGMGKVYAYPYRCV